MIALLVFCAVVAAWVFGFVVGIKYERGERLEEEKRCPALVSCSIGNSVLQTKRERTERCELASDHKGPHRYTIKGYQNEGEEIWWN